ncbi:hypothetical protein ACQ4PT_011597 [Festuca glaucescens]
MAFFVHRSCKVRRCYKRAALLRAEVGAAARSGGGAANDDHWSCKRPWQELQVPTMVLQVARRSCNGRTSELQWFTAVAAKLYGRCCKRRREAASDSGCVASGARKLQAIPAVLQTDATRAASDSGGAANGRRQSCKRCRRELQTASALAKLRRHLLRRRWRLAKVRRGCAQAMKRHGYTEGSDAARRQRRCWEQAVLPAGGGGAASWAATGQDSRRRWGSDQGHPHGGMLTLVGAAASAVLHRDRIRYSYTTGVDVTMVDADEDERPRRALLQAVMDGDLDTLASTCVPSCRSPKSVLVLSHSSGGAGMAAELKSGTGPGAAGIWASCSHSALHLAAANGRVRVCRYLVQDLGFPVDAWSSSGDTPLVLAATHGHTKTAAYLLERGANPHAPDSHGETPLHWAACNGNRELAMLLLQRGVDPDATNPRGTPLHVAASRAYPEIVALLLSHRADPNKVANCVFTPLVSSIVSSSLECMKLLIQAGANVNTGGFSGTTPLFIACNLSGAVPFVKCLLEAGANPNATDEVIKASCIKKDEMKQQGYSAFKKKDYDAAILFYNMALKFDCTDTDATLYSNRSICWLRLGVGEEALSDAQECTRMRPDWAKGYYRQGMAFCLLQESASAYDAFLKASKLDPGNADINEAIRAVSARRNVS